MNLTVDLVWCETLDQLNKECGLYDGDKVLCVDADGIVRRLQWDEKGEVLKNAQSVMFEPYEFVELCLGQAR